MVDEKDFLLFMKIRLRLGDKTVVTRKSRFRIFMAWLKGRDITQQCIDEFLNYLKEDKKISNTSLNVYIHTLYSLQKYLIYRGVPTNFMDGIRLFPEDEPFIEALTKDEIDRLMHTRLPVRYKRSKDLEEVNYNATVFLCLTGCRWEEMIKLQCQYVDLSEHKLSFVDTKNRQVRRVYFIEPLSTILTKQTQRKKPSDFVFSNTVGGTLHQPDFRENLQKRAKLARLTKRVTPHVLRHSYAELLYIETGDLYLVKDVLGHKSIQSTESYVRNVDERIKEAQLGHPLWYKNRDPLFIIGKVEEKIKQTNILQDERFDWERVQKALSNFLLNLNEAIM